MGIQHNSNKFTLEKHKMTKKASNDLTSQCGFDKDPSALLALLMLRREEG